MTTASKGVTRFTLRFDEAELLAAYRKLRPQDRLALREVVNDRVQESGTTVAARERSDVPQGNGNE